MQVRNEAARATLLAVCCIAPFALLQRLAGCDAWRITKFVTDCSYSEWQETMHAARGCDGPVELAGREKYVLKFDSVCSLDSFSSIQITGVLASQRSSARSANCLLA